MCFNSDDEACSFSHPDYVWLTTVVGNTMLMYGTMVHNPLPSYYMATVDSVRITVVSLRVALFLIILFWSIFDILWWKSSQSKLIGTLLSHSISPSIILLDNNMAWLRSSSPTVVDLICKAVGFTSALVSQHFSFFALQNLCMLQPNYCFGDGKMMILVAV